MGKMKRTSLNQQTVAIDPSPDWAALIGSIPATRKRGKHVIFTEIRIKYGRVEFDYQVSAGNMANDGTMTVRYDMDDELGKVAQQLAEQFAKLYQDLEKA